MEVSNNLIAALLVLAVVVSAANLFGGGGRVAELSGMVTQGKANVSVQSSASVTFVSGYNETYFGQGTPGTSLTTISTVQTNTNGYYNGSHCNGTTYGTGTFITPLCIYNDGNSATTTVTITASQNAGYDPWLDCGQSTPANCDQTPTAEVRAFNNSTNACTSGLLTTWTTLGTSAATLCSAFGIGEYMEIALRLGLPSNMEANVEHYTTLTITAA